MATLKLFAIDNTAARRDYAYEYWQLKRAIRLCHRNYNPIAAAVLRHHMNRVFKCWQGRR